MTNNYKKLTARFKNGTEALYTDRVLSLLMTEPTVVDIADAETGEILFIRDESGDMLFAETYRKLHQR